MGDFDELCFLCGVSPEGPSEFTMSPRLTAGDLANALFEHFPDILSAIPTYGTKEDLEGFLELMFTEDVPDDFNDLSEAFEACVAIGYFDFDGDTPRKETDDPTVKFLFPDGRFVKKRLVDDPSCGEFRMVNWDNDPDTGGVGQTMDMSRTGASFQGGFGNFFLSRCCFGFLKGWIKWHGLPPMRDGRQLSFIGELWEIVNSRRSGRGSNGCLEWLEPGGAEKKLNQTQYVLATYQEKVYPVKTAAVLQSGCSKDSIKRAIYDDYGYWMFVSPHEWPEASEGKELIEVTSLGFGIPPRASQIPFSLGHLSGLAIEILHQIFRHLPDVSTYLSLKLVCKGMHDIVTDTKFAYPVLREILGPDPNREMFWIHPLENQPQEVVNFMKCLNSWLSLRCSSVKKESFTAWDILSHCDFPLVQFIYSLYTSDNLRNRRRLWKNVKKFEEVWVDYRVNGWEVNRFGLPYTES